MINFKKSYHRTTAQTRWLKTKHSTKVLIETALKSLLSYCQSYPTAGHFDKNRHVYQILKNSNDKSKGVVILLELTSSLSYQRNPLYFEIARLSVFGPL